MTELITQKIKIGFFRYPRSQPRSNLLSLSKYLQNNISLGFLLMVQGKLKSDLLHSFLQEKNVIFDMEMFLVESRKKFPLLNSKK